MPSRAQHRRPAKLIVVLATTLGLVAAVAASFSTIARASDSVASEEQEGAKLLRTFDGGKQSCASLSDREFERIGEYVMGRMAGSTRAHESMNRAMTNMMSNDAEEAMHVALGKRFTGCGTGSLPGNFGQVMGMMAGRGGPGVGGSMMGDGRSFDGNGAGMFGDSGDDGWNAATIVMVALMGLLILAVIGAVFFWRPRPRTSAPSALEVLQTSFARGDIDADEYQRRRQALGV